MEMTHQKSVGEIVAHDYRTAAVFEKHGIDFCCKGGTALSVACAKKDIALDDLLAEIEQFTQDTDGEMVDYSSWSAVALIDHIESKHHAYVEEKVPVILQFLNKLCRVHGERHPELHAIFNLFSQSAADLAQHMKKEELILFPRIRKLATRPSDMPVDTPGMVDSPIKVMMHEHDTEGERFREMARLSNDYQPPADGCTTYRVAFAMLREFEQDLHLHIHLENNILFPKAIQMEQAITGNANSIS